jgi:hypothetical protein
VSDFSSTEDFDKTADIVPEGAMHTLGVRIAGWIDENGEERFAVNVTRDTRYSDCLGLLAAAQGFIFEDLKTLNDGGDD